MLSFTALLALEKPKIHQALEEAVQALPHSVREVAAYALLAGGKRLRPLLTLTMARLFGADKGDIYPLSCLLEMIHVATLLHDDVLDDASSRRGQPAAHARYGISPCILAGDALLAQACFQVASYGQPALVQCISDAIVQTVAGECQEIALQGSLSHSTDEYINIITGKTGWLIRAACELGALYAHATPDQVEAATTFGLHLGIAFQMVDDALDFADEARTGKPMGGDLREGKFTPPVAYYVNSLSPAERQVFAEKFAHKNTAGLSDLEVQNICHVIREQGFDAKARELADAHLEKARVALERLPKCKEQTIFTYVIDYVRNRDA